MNRKSIIICICTLAVLVGAIAVAVAYLYSGVPETKGKAVAQVADDSRYMLLTGVPSDALAVLCFSDASSAGNFTPFGSFNCRMTVSLHYSGNMAPLYVFDAGKASDQQSKTAQALVEKASTIGYFCEYLDCSKIAGRDKRLATRSVVIASPSEVILKSAKRHIEKNVSVLDLEGFAVAAGRISSSDAMFICNTHCPRLSTKILSKNFRDWGEFASRMSSWTVASLDNVGGGDLTLSGKFLCDDSPSWFMNVLDKVQPSHFSYSDVIPSYTVAALSMPVTDFRSYSNAYKSFLDSKQMLQERLSLCSKLSAKAGVSPEDFFSAQGVAEVATASFLCSSGLQRVNMVRLASRDAKLIPESSKDGRPEAVKYMYSGFLASVFGSLFSLDDESYCVVTGDWVISGSADAVGEYASGRALEYPLGEYLSDAGKEGLLNPKQAILSSYFNLKASQAAWKDIFAKDMIPVVADFAKDCDVCPLTFSIGVGKERSAFRADLRRLKLKKTKAPVYERDTTVTVPSGPFRVKNSATGRVNLFYQQENLYLCLKEETGKGLWGIPFDKKICGTAQTVDFFANGKLQFLFGAGDSIYLIDRLGRFVKGFPVRLGKEILIGPDVYDFNSNRKYNIMVLHKDNTVEMYNLKGQKPSSWQGIKSHYTIKSLPERVKVGKKSVWVVKTSVCTLLFPFEGGKTLTDYKGNDMIRPDSEIKVVDEATVEFGCYDGTTKRLVL